MTERTFANVPVHRAADVLRTANEMGLRRGEDYGYESSRCEYRPGMVHNPATGKMKKGEILRTISVTYWFKEPISAFMLKLRL